MPSYKYKGDRPVDIPEFGLERIQPGATVTVNGEIRHSDFQLVQAKAEKNEAGGGQEG